MVLNGIRAIIAQMLHKGRCVMEKKLATIILESLNRDHYIDRDEYSEIVCAINAIVRNDEDVDLDWSGNGFFEKNDFYDDYFHEGDRIWRVKEFRATSHNTGESVVIYTDYDCKFFLTRIENMAGETLGFCIASKTSFGNLPAMDKRRAIVSLIEKAYKDGQKALDRKLKVIPSIACTDYYYEIFNNESKTA